MQIIEKTPFSVRSAVYRMKKEDLEFVLFPMVHVGTQKFYDEVYERLSHCDLIFVEGIQSKKANLLTRSYRVVRRINRLELVLQSDALKLRDFEQRVINTDIVGRDFDKSWSALPWMTRAILVFGVPIYAIYLLLFGTRAVIAEHLAMDDLPGRDETLHSADFLDPYKALLYEQRDRCLLERISELESTHRGRTVVAIVYGAGHMRSIIGYFNQHNYRIADSEWLMVFDL
jgi:hypothetical protein